jgi:hypothetical protein
LLIQALCCIHDFADRAGLQHIDRLVAVEAVIRLDEEIQDGPGVAGRQGRFGLAVSMLCFVRLALSQ